MSAPILIHDIFSSGLAQRVGWALFHFLWQGTAIALLLALVLQLLRRRSPQARWLASCAALGVMAALPVITAFLVSVEPQRPIGTHPAMGTATPAGAGDLPYLAPAELAAGGDVGQPKSPPSETIAPPLQRPWTERMEALLRPLLPWFVLLWVAGVAVLSVWHVGGWWHLQRTKRLDTRPIGGLAGEVFGELVQRLRVRRRVMLLESARAAVPVVVGWLRPVVLLPASAMSGLTPEQIQAVLAHELAHVRRHDCLVKVVQAVVETLLFYHPAVWWVSGRINHESEQCCDDLALQVCGDRQAYAGALARVAALGHGAPRLTAASSGGKLLPRIRRIMNLEKEGQAMGTRWVAGAMTLGVAALLGIGPLVLAGVARSDASAQQLGNGKDRSGTTTATGAVIRPAKAPPLQGVTFGPVIERTVNDDSVSQDMYVDLDAGKLFTRPEEGLGLQQWFRQQGIDALCDVDAPVSGLLGIDMVIWPMPDTTWETLGPKELSEQGLGGSAKPPFPVSMSAAGKLPATFVFRTRQGGVGILQIVGFTEQPRGVKIRYKMVQGAAAPLADTSAERPRDGSARGEVVGGGIGSDIKGAGAGGGRRIEEDKAGPKILIDLKLSKLTAKGEELIWSPESLILSNGKKAYVAQSTSFDYVRKPDIQEGSEPDMGAANMGVDMRIAPRLQRPVAAETRRTIGLGISLTVRWIRGYVAGTNAPVIGGQEYEATVLVSDGETKAISVSPEVPPEAKGLPAPEDSTGPRYVLRVTAKVLPEPAVER